MTRAQVVTVAEAVELVRGGALLVDIREDSERASGVIPGALHADLSSLGHGKLSTPAGRPVIFHCRSGGRTAKNADVLASLAPDTQVYFLEGGIEKWRDAGYPLESPA